MTVEELYPALRELGKADKLKVIQFLASELEHQIEPRVLVEGEYPVWSPLNAVEAAQILQDAMEADRKARHG